MTTPAEAVEILNRIHAADPTVLQALIEHRVPCNYALAEDPTVQVGLRADWLQAHRDDPNPTTRREYEVGFLGIVNGLFGARANGWGWIGADWEGDIDGSEPGRLLGFVLLEDRDVGIT